MTRETASSGRTRQAADTPGLSGQAADAPAVARARAAAREAATPRIDYARMQAVFPKQKAALTRAVKANDVGKVIAACKSAMTEWDEIGAWPDDWARWQRALDDVLPWNQQVDLRDLR